MEVSIDVSMKLFEDPGELWIYVRDKERTRLSDSRSTLNQNQTLLDALGDPGVDVC